MVDLNEMTATTFLQLHNFFARYIQCNMLLPGQVEKYIGLVNINKFSLKDLPINLFKEVAVELQINFIDCAENNFVVDMSWIQNVIVKMMQSFLDPVVAAR